MSSHPAVSLVSLEVLIGGAHGSVSLLRALGEGGAGGGAGCFSSESVSLLGSQPVSCPSVDECHPICRKHAARVSLSDRSADSKSARL